MSAIRRKFLSRNKWRTLALVFAGAFLGVGLVAGSISLVSHLVSAAPTVPVPSISLTSQHSSYASNTPGAWNIEKSAEWVGVNTARITFDIETIQKVHDNVSYDILFVTDISGSMSGNKLTQVMADASELTESLLSNANNRIALISFADDARIESGFTSDKDLILQKINSFSAVGTTNYYDSLVKADEVLEGYTEQSNRELVLLFLTDGFPNVDTPNEVGQYELLKQKYPYITINGVQYEMGDTVLDPIKAVSDNQFIASMTSLNNVLFEASVAPYTYDKFVLADFINDEYFRLDDIRDISADRGTISLDYDGNTPKVTWDLSGVLHPGGSIRMTIDIILKDTYTTISGLYPTNKRTTVESILDDTPTENIITTNTPVLKNSYNVTYEANSPSDCTVSGMPNPLSEERPIFNTIEISNAKPTCGGYNFAGYTITTPGVEKINDDYFIMPEKDVTIRATWTKISMEKSMDGTVHEIITATFDSGSTINVKMKKLAGQSNATYNTTNTNIIAFKRADLLSENVDINDDAYILSSPDSLVPIYGWYDSSDHTIYYYTDAEVVAASSSLVYLFRYMTSLNDISGLSGWDTSKVTDMSFMFYRSSSITDLSSLAGWDTSKVMDMRYMFSEATSLADISGLSGWDTSRIFSTDHMFTNTAITNTSALAGWNTSKVTDMESMFANASSLTSLSGLSGWDTSKVTNMSYTFYNASSLADISGLSGWDTSKVTDMKYLFEEAKSLSDISALSGWDTSKVTNMSYMFSGAKSISNISALANWNTSSVTTMYNMFGGTKLTNVSALANWNTSSVKSFCLMFYSIPTLTDISGLSGWDTSSAANMFWMFLDDSSLANISALANWNTSSVKSLSLMFRNTAITNTSALANWDTSSVTDMSGIFQETSSLTNISALANWNTSSVTDMSSVFSGASSLTDISAISNWNTSNVTTMRGLFSKASSLTDISAISNWNTSNVTDMGWLFNEASSLADVSALSNWDTSSVTDMSKMFYNATAITSFTPLNNWNTSSVTNMTDIFYGIPSSVPRPSWY